MLAHTHVRAIALSALSGAFLVLAGSEARGQTLVSVGPPATIDFRVTADGGQPVLDLKPTDVTLKVNGKPREVRELTLVHFESGGTDAPAVPAAPAFASNVQNEARDIVLLVDEQSIAPGKEGAVKNAMNALVAAFGPRDRIGVLSLRQGGVSVAPTARRQAVTSAINSLEGHALSGESQSDFTCRSRQALMSVQGLFSPSDTPAHTIVFYSASLAVPTGSDRMITMGTSSGLCQLTTANFDDFGKAVHASRANLFIVHALESSPNVDPQALGAGLENMAGVSESTIVRLGPNASTVMASLARQTSAYYLASFDPEPGERNGSTYRVELKVGRDGVKTRSRGDVTIAKAGAKPLTAADMITVATTYSDLPLRGVGFPSRNPGDEKVRVLALCEPIEAGTKLTGAVIALFDDKGKLRGKSTVPAADLGKRPIAAALVVPPGVYRMRIAATDELGRAGTIDYELHAELTPAGPMKLSSLVAGIAQNGFTPKLLLTPAEPVLVGYFEAYGVPAAATVTATLELAATEDAPAMATAETKINKANTEDMRIIYGGFDIAGLKPGEYVMRAIVTADGKPVGRLTRTLRKVER